MAPDAGGLYQMTQKLEDLRAKLVLKKKGRTPASTTERVGHNMLASWR